MFSSLGLGSHNVLVFLVSAYVNPDARLDFPELFSSGSTFSGRFSISPRLLPCIREGSLGTQDT